MMNTNINNQRIEYIDFAKALAILSIVIYHYSLPYVSGILSKLIMVGGAGVHLFFILSGFGIGLAPQPIQTLKFYQKRFFKILIPYYVVILIIFTINLIYPIYKNDGLYALGGHLFFYKMFDENIMTSFGYHFWFISTIVQFYLFFPLLAYVRQKIHSDKKFLVISLVISFSYWIILGFFKLYDQRIFNSSFLQYLWEFNLGVVLASLYISKNFILWESNKFVCFFLSILSFLIAAFLELKGGIGRIFNDVFSSLGFLCISIFLYAICKSRFFLIKEFMIYISKISYEFYLVHLLIFVLINSWLNNLLLIQSNIIYSFLLIFPISIIAAHLLMKFLKWFYRQPFISKLM